MNGTPPPIHEATNDTRYMTMMPSIENSTMRRMRSVTRTRRVA